MQFLTITLMLLGAALAAPTPHDDVNNLAAISLSPQNKAHVRRSDAVSISDITLRANNNLLSYASIKLQWGAQTVWCVHQPGIQQKCDINGKKIDEFNFHMEHKNYMMPGRKAGEEEGYATFFVSRGNVVADSFLVGPIKCNDQFAHPNQVRFS